MWRTGRVFCFGSAGKRAVGRCCNNPRRPLSSSAPSKTVKAEKEKRKRGREEAILSSQHGVCTTRAIKATQGFFLISQVYFLSSVNEQLRL